MASAFHLPMKQSSFNLQASQPTNAVEFDKSKGRLQDVSEMKDERFIKFHNHYDSDETEDEEVKAHCIGAINIYMTSDSEEDYSDDYSSASNEDSKENLHDATSPPSITCHIPKCIVIHRPRPILGSVTDIGDSNSDESTTKRFRYPLHLKNEMRSEDSGNADDEKSLEGDCVDDETHQLSLENSSGGNDTESCDNSTSAATSILEENCSKDISVPIEVSLPINGGEEDYTLPCHSHFEDMLYKLENKDSKENLNSIYLSTRKRKCPFNTINKEENKDQSFKRMNCNESGSIRELLTEFSHPTIRSNKSMKQSDSSDFLSSLCVYKNDKETIEELIENDFIKDNKGMFPVPLLSPPLSPSSVESDQCQLTTLCEWPCESVVDTFLNSYTCKPLYSPATLINMEEDENDRIMSYYLRLETGTKLNPISNGTGIVT